MLQETVWTLSPLRHVHAVLLQVTEPTTGGVLKKKVALEILQNSQENTCAKVSFLIKKGLWHKCFPVNFVKFLGTTLLRNTSGRLLLFLFACISEEYFGRDWVLPLFFVNLFQKLTLSHS